MYKIVFTGGGSAGHVIPNVAVIEEIQKIGSFDVYYLGTTGIEQKIIAPMKIPYRTLTAPKLKRGFDLDSIKNNLAIPVRFLRAVKQAKAALQEIQPDLVFSKGGYVSLPVVFAAAKLKIPCLSHESDLSPGLANRLMQGKCERILTAFPETADRFKNGAYCGQPLRSSLFGKQKSIAKKHFADGTGRKVILVFGGGSGSNALNEAVRKHAPELTKRYFIIHVCGKGNTLESRLQNYRQYEFIADMGMAYAAADLIISRAGAGAVFEAVALKKPAIFVPLEGQTRGDQKENAEYFFSRGLCYTLPQSRLSELRPTIEAALADKKLKERLISAPYGSGTAAAVQAIKERL